MQRFTGSVQDIGPVITVHAVRWITAIPFEEWPQQRLDRIMPAMVTDLSWHGLGEIFTPVVQQAKPLSTRSYQWMLSAVMPGDGIEPHVDQQADYWLARVHVPLTTNDLSAFIVEGTAYRMELGRAYLVNTLREHSVVNFGEAPRIHFMFDVRS